MQKSGNPLYLILMMAAIALSIAFPAAAAEGATSRLVITERTTGKKLQILVVDRQGGAKTGQGKASEKKASSRSAQRRVFVGRELANVPRGFYENIGYRSDEEIELLLNPSTVPAGGSGAVLPGARAPVKDPTNFYIRKAAASPLSWVSIEGFSCRALTAARWVVLRGLLSEKFPGRRVVISSTTNGRHMSAAHPDGRALDFCVLPLTTAESRTVELLCRLAGFEPFNEYIYDSPLKTGPHMHVSL